MDAFEKILRERKNRTFVLIDPRGGKGDILIKVGLEKKLKEYAIKYSCLDYVPENVKTFEIRKFVDLFKLPASIKHKVENWFASLSKRHSEKQISKIEKYDVALLRGGGYLNDFWCDYDVLRYILKYSAGDIILGPHSFYFKNNIFFNIINSSHKNIFIFCREKYSYDLLLSMPFMKNIHVYLSDDSVFYLSKNDFPLSQKNPAGLYDLICIRSDIELKSTIDTKTLKIKKASDKKDAQNSSCKILIGDVESVHDYLAYISIVLGARKVFTTRLHVGVLAAILGKETYLYPISYFKNQGVYEYSLYKFPNVHFMTDGKS